jgi:hypothetical protein
MGRKRKFKTTTQRGLGMQPVEENNDYKLNIPEEEEVTGETTAQELSALFGIEKEEKVKIESIKDFFKASWVALKKWMPILWEATAYEFKTASKMQIIMCIILVVVIFKVAGINTATKTDDSIFTKRNPSSNNLAKEEKRNQAQKRFALFKSADKREILFKWFEITGEWRYVSGGSNQFNQGDCIAAVDANLQYWGALLPRENVQARYNRLERLRALGATKIVTSMYELKAGDIMIFRNGSSYYHEAMIYDITPTSQIRYLEMGGAASVSSMSTIPWGDPRVIIYSTTIEVWLSNDK